MPYTTYANQKSIRIHKPAVSRDFLQIDNKEWMDSFSKIVGQR